MKSRKELLTQDKSILSGILLLAWPIVCQSLLQVVIGTVDIKMVGSFGDNAIAAVGFGRQIVMIAMVLVMAISTGATAMVARFIGMGDHKQASSAAGQAFILALLISVIMVPLGLLTQSSILNLMGAGPETSELAIGYMTVFFLSVPLFLLNFVARSIFQGAGDTVTPLIIDIVMNLLNILFNYIFIFGFGPIPTLGVTGAAIGTALARLVGASLGWGALLTGKFIITITFQQLYKPVFKVIKQILTIGLPAGLQGLSRNLSTVIIFALLARTTAEDLANATFTIGMNLNQYALMPGLAIGTAAATLSGMNLGAGNKDRAEKSGYLCMLLAAGFMSTVALIFVIFSTEFLTFFSSEASPELISMGRTLLICLALAEPFHAMAIIFSRSMQGAGYTLMPFLTTLFSWLFVRVPLAYYLAFQLNMQETGIWVAIASTNFLAGMLNFIFFKTGKWKTVKIDSKDDDKERSAITLKKAI
ncbi:MATE family efflux transporter [Proteinivorax hydrogeniformans]|uniref:Probable multidrug resistance protein NorM n=1 Tax=Proteinivorax hydrogeniformans TaxID=1826727 RepID=A0AAU8HVT8_9FIRM